jgi:hypothetical protein
MIFVDTKDKKVCFHCYTMDNYHRFCITYAGVSGTPVSKKAVQFTTHPYGIGYKGGDQIHILNPSCIIHRYKDAHDPHLFKNPYDFDGEE